MSNIDCRGKEYEKIPVGKAKDLTGLKFGRLTANFRVREKAKEVFWLCTCDCDNKVVVRSSALLSKKTKSCGCLQREFASKLGEKSRDNISGKIFNDIEVLSLATDYKKENNIMSKNAYWKCRCFCGNEFFANSGELKRFSISSCGCSSLSVGEQKIKRILEENEITFLHNTSFFKDLRFDSGLPGRYDFIILDELRNPTRIIEFDGLQHFNKNSFRMSEDEFALLKIRDNIKTEYALRHNIPLVRIPYNRIKDINLQSLFDNTFIVTEC